MKNQINEALGQLTYIIQNEMTPEFTTWHISYTMNWTDFKINSCKNNCDL